MQPRMQPIIKRVEMPHPLKSKKARCIIKVEARDLSFIKGLIEQHPVMGDMFHELWEKHVKVFVDLFKVVFQYINSTR